MTSIVSDFIQQRALWEQLKSYGTAHSFRRQSFIYTPTQAAQTLYLLLAGQVNLQLISSSGRALTVQVVEAGQIFGHSALTGSQTYDTFAEVIKPTSAIVLSREEVQRAVQEQPSLGMLLLDTLGRYRMAIGRRLEEVAFKSVPARLASLLLDMAEAAPDEQQSRLPHRTHQQLAEMINAYRETVTKVINQFRAARLLDIDRSGIVLLNLSGLRELAQG